MTLGVTMVIDGRETPEKFLESFPKSPCQFTYVLQFTASLCTHTPIEYPTFLGDLIPVLGGHQ